MSFSRRTFLGGAGLGALAPFVPSLASLARAAGAPPRRLLLFFTPNGQPNDKNALWWGATGTETSFNFGKTLAPLQSSAKDLILAEGIAMKSYELQGTPNDHNPVLGHVLTANDVIDPADGSKPGSSSTWFASSISIDQMIANRIGSTTKYPSMVLGVKSGGANGRLSYRGPKDPVPPQNDPVKLFDSVFAGVTGDAGSADKIRLQHKSVIDAVAGELQTLDRRLPSDDRMKLQAHLERLRALETRLAVSAPVAGCKPTAPVTDTALASFVMQGRQMMDLVQLIFACNLTRVINLQWSSAANGMSFPWAQGARTTIDGKEVGGYHDLAHRPATDAVMEAVSGIGAWFAGEFKGMLDRLRDTKEENGSLLQNTTVLWYNEHGSPRSGHPRGNMPYVIAGQGGGYWRTGRWVKFSGASHADLYVNLAHAMGLPDVNTFGNRMVSKGPLAGLSV